MAGTTAVADPVIDEALSIDEIMERYRGEWLLIRVTDHDEDGWPTHGHVTVHAASQKAMLDEMERQTDPPELAQFTRYSFLAEPDIYVDDPAEFHRLLREEIEADRASCV
jgi:hypothetical protein